MEAEKNKPPQNNQNKPQVKPVQNKIPIQQKNQQSPQKQPSIKMRRAPLGAHRTSLSTLP
jgi:hypothetical protein